MARDLPGVRKDQIEEFAEPVYYVPMYGPSRITEQTRPPVPVVRMRADSEPLVLDVGRLPRSLHVVRVIAAIDTDDVRPNPKPLVMRCCINDGPEGQVSSSIRRCRAVDGFYCVAEWYFYTGDDRRRLPGRPSRPRQLSPDAEPGPDGHGWRWRGHRV